MRDWQKIGKFVALGGAIALAVVLGLAVRDFWGGTRACSGSAANIPANTTVYAAQKEFYLNGALCIALKAEKYFALERKDVDNAALAVDKANEDLALAEKETDSAKAQKLREDGQKRLDDAKKQLVAAKAALSTQPAAQAASLYIDDVRTPVSMDLYISNPIAAVDGWTWKSLTLIAPTDSDSDSGKLWRQILSGTPFEGSRTVTLGLGDSNGKLPRPNAVMADKITLRVYDWQMLVLGALGIVLLAVGLIMWGWNTGLLRDPAPPADPAKPAPFSLARTQFAWWLFLVTGGFLYVWLTTGQFLGVMTPGVLTLLGISATSGLAAVLIDPTPNTVPPRGFFRDILSDSNTVVLHRVQMFAWTVILGLILLWTVATSFTFPKFDANLLLMAGIASGIYLGFKFPEK
jgi:hypothetical protein